MSVAVLHKNQLVYAGGFGKRNKTDPYTINTLQPVSSLTKTFTATAIGELVAEGKLDWNTTPVTKYLPDFQLKNSSLTSQITFADLLGENSGLPYNLLSWHKSTLPRKELIKQLRYLDDISSTQEGNIKHSDVAYAVAGEAAANVAGTSFEQLVFDKVIRPLGLKSTGISQSHMKLHSDNYALSNMAYSFEAAQRGEFQIFPLDENPNRALAPAEDIYTNVIDLALWGKVIMDLGAVDGEQVLNRMSVEETLKANSFAWNENSKSRWKEFDPIYSYGFGWMQDTFCGQRHYTAYGADMGYGSDVTMFPDHDIVIAMLANTSMFSHVCSFLPYSIATPLFNAPGMQINKDSSGEHSWIQASAVPMAKEAYTAVELAAEGIFSIFADADEKKPLTFEDDLGAYIGDYAHPFWGKFEITLVDREEVKGGKVDEKKGEKDRKISSSNFNQEEGTDEGKEPVLRFRYNEYTSTLEHYNHNTFIATFDDVLFKMRVLMSFLPEVETSKELSDSKEFPRENLMIQELPWATGINEVLFSKTKNI
ncbi:hypothetical protein BGZ96_003791 [Linnemannia gamsii]|uniref:Beta-lactamase-related domain-containing protein n=1 Tax=Linnemannia gamsii TaxID=64522 RepID=A0ABQ7JIW9_9FUNG|nr:hypothetical protein BGZ96_003791 [Linnemannia gamsii]